MIYLNDALNHYNTNLILENCVSTIQKEQRKNFVFNPIPKNFLNIIMNLVFSLKYKIIFWLNKISRVLNVLYSSRILKNINLKFYNQFFLQNTILIPKIIKLDNTILTTKNNLNFFFKKNNSYSVFNFQNKKINFKLLKKKYRYKKKKLSVVKKYWNSTHKLLKKKKKRLIYSWSKKRFIKPKTFFFYIYPSALWNFFKWTRLSNYVKPLNFFDKFKFSFKYKIKFFSKPFFFKNFNIIKNNFEFSPVIPQKKNIEKKFVKKSTYNKFYKKKLKRYKLVKFFFYIFKNIKLNLYISSYRYYNPFYKNIRKFKKKSYKRQLRCRKSYKKYFSKKRNFFFFIFNKNFNKRKILNYFYKLKNKYYILSSIYKRNVSLENKLPRIFKYRNQLYIILSKVLKQLYFNKTLNINLSCNTSNNCVNLHKKTWINLIFFHYLKINFLKYKYLIKHFHKNNVLIKKTKISLKFFYKILNTQIVCNPFAANWASCNIFYIKYIFNKNKLQDKFLIFY